MEDGREPYVVAAARALAREGWSVGLASPEPNVRAARSRFVSNWHHVPSPSDGLGQFGDATAAAIREGGYDLVFGGDDTEVLAVSAVRDRLPVVVPYASHDAVQATIDKLSLTRAAERAGLSTPTTVEADEDAVESFPLPAIVKARLHWTPGGGGPGRFPVRLVHDRAALARRVEEIAAAGSGPLLQAPVEGTLAAISVVVGRSGRLLAVVQQESLRQTLSGTSARARTVPVDDDLAGRVVALLQDLGWSGLANLQFLCTPAGARYLIDCNGRFYGSLALAVASGANLPAIWAGDAMGDDERPDVARGRAGVRFQAFEADLLRARRRPSGPVALDVASTLAFAAGATHSTWKVDDPVPALAWVASRVAARFPGSVRPRG